MACQVYAKENKASTHISSSDFSIDMDARGKCECWIGYWIDRYGAVDDNGIINVESRVIVMIHRDGVVVWNDVAKRVKHHLMIISLASENKTSKCRTVLIIQNLGLTDEIAQCIVSIRITCRNEGQLPGDRR